MTRPPDSKSKTKQIVFLPKNIEDEKMAEDFKKLCIQDDLQIHDLMVEAISLVFRQHHFPPGNHLRFCSSCHRQTFRWTCCGKRTSRVKIQPSLKDKL